MSIVGFNLGVKLVEFNNFTTDCRKIYKKSIDFFTIRPLLCRDLIENYHNWLMNRLQNILY